MKIAIIGPAYPYRGGLAAFNERLAREFSAAGHEVEVYTFTLQYPSFLFPGKTQYSDGEKPSDMDIKRCVNSVNPVNWLCCGAGMRKQNIDIVKTTIPLL